MQTQNNSGGFTILELLVAIAVIALAAVGSLTLYGRVAASQQADQVGKQIMLVQTAIKELYPDTNRAGLTTAGLISAGKIPDAMLNSARTAIVHAGGGTIDVAPATLAGGLASSGYSITSQVLDKAQCASVATAMAMTFPEVDIGDTVIKSPTSPASAAAITDACATGGVVIAPPEEDPPIESETKAFSEKARPIVVVTVVRMRGI